jgi:hypothetical protein
VVAFYYKEPEKALAEIRTEIERTKAPARAGAAPLR